MNETVSGLFDRLRTNLDVLERDKDSVSLVAVRMCVDELEAEWRKDLEDRARIATVAALVNKRDLERMRKKEKNAIRPEGESQTQNQKQEKEGKASE